MLFGDDSPLLTMIPMRENSEVVIIHPDNWKILMDNITNNIYTLW